MDKQGSVRSPKRKCWFSPVFLAPTLLLMPPSTQPSYSSMPTTGGRILVETRSERAFASEVLDVIAKGNPSEVAHFVQSGGIQIVERHKDWEKSRTASSPNGDHRPIECWQEDIKSFSVDDIRKTEFAAALAQFRGLLQKSMLFSRPPPISSSLRLWDHWRVRNLGPAFEGKVASNKFWYVQLVRERTGWRIWRLETTIH